MRSNRRRLIWVLVGLVALLVIVALGSVAVYLVLRARPVATAATWQDPIVGIVPDQIAPELALYPLAGASELDTIDLAIDNQQPYTAYAGLLFALTLADAQRSGRLLEVAGQFSDAGQPELVQLVFQQVYDLAVLSPELNDPLRADALLSSGSGWAAVKQDELAMLAYDQAHAIALYSPYLQTAHRRDLLQKVAAACTQMGWEEQAAQCRRDTAELDDRLHPQPPDLDEDPIGLFGSPQPVSSEQIGLLEESRRQAAYAVLEALSTGRQPAPEQLAALAQALQAEDQAKLSLYQQELDATTQPGRKTEVHWALLEWLTLKYKISMKGFGLSVVPDWEAQAPAIRSDLSKAYEALRFDYEDRVTSLPDASLMEPGRYEVWRWLALAGRLGQYPNYPEEQMGAKLQETARNLIATGLVTPLFVDVESGSGGLRYLLSPAAAYGQTATAPQ